MADVIPRIEPGEVLGPFTIEIDPYAAFYAESRALALARSSRARKIIRRPSRRVLLEAAREVRPRWFPVAKDWPA